jgi:hypothetical protein
MAVPKLLQAQGYNYVGIMPLVAVHAQRAAGMALPGHNLQFDVQDIS